MPQLDDPQTNGMLAALPDADFQRLRPLLHRVDLTAGQVLVEQGRPRVYAYFPTSTVITMTYTLKNGASTAIALVGREGFVGACLLLDGGTMTTGSSVLIPGQAFRVGAQTIRGEFERSAAMRHVFLCCIQALSTQISQAVACCRHHTIEQRVCSWLLHCLDRVEGSEFVATHEVISNMLGVRREGVTEVAGRLKADGHIRYKRGCIEVLDRAAIQRLACECHVVVKMEYDRLLRPDRIARLNASLPSSATPSLVEVTQAGP